MAGLEAVAYGGCGVGRLVVLVGAGVGVRDKEEEEEGGPPCAPGLVLGSGSAAVGVRGCSHRDRDRANLGVRVRDWLR